MTVRYRITGLRAALCAAGAALALPAFPALAQQPTGTPPRYYPGNPPPSQYANGQKQRLTTPVVAGADGVRPVSAQEAEALKPEAAKSPAFFPPPADGTPYSPVEARPNPTVTADRPVPKPPAEPAKLPPAAVPSVAVPGATGLPNLPSVGAMASRQTPALSVEFKMPDSTGVGQPLTYVLVVRNTGTTPVSNVRVEEETPAGTAFVGSEPATEAAAEGKMAWSLGGMEAGSEKRIKVTVKPTDEGEVRSRATLTFSAAVEARVKVTRPKLSVTMTAPDVVRVGDSVAFKVTVNNVGTGPAMKIPLQARFTEGLTYRNEKGEPIEGLIETEWANLPAGQSRTFVLNLTAAKPGPQQCVLTAFADANPAEACKAAVTLVEPQLVAKQSGPSKCLVKSEPTYQIDLTNPGTATTDPISAWTVLPEGFEFVSASDSGVFTPATKAVMWRLAGLPAGGSKSVTVKLRAAGPSDSAVRSVVQSGPADAATGPGVTQVAAKSRTLEVRCDTPVKAEGVPALRFEVTGQEGLVEVGKEAVYEVKVTNMGTGACTNVTLEAELADGTAAAGAAGPTAGRTTGQKIVFDPIANLGVKGEAIYKVRVKGAAAGDMRFRVKVACDQVKTPSVKEENTRFYKE